MTNVAIFFGGKSVEHDISIITALQVMRNIDKEFNLIPIYIKPDGTFVTAKNLNISETFLNYNSNVKKENEVSFIFVKSLMMITKNKKIKKIIKIDCAVLCNHGHGGEDGSLQGLLELCEIPYSSCNVAASALCMDKNLTKIILTSAHINTPTHVYFNKCEYKTNKVNIINKISKKIAFPCIVKPASLGSSVGISICENIDKLEKSIEDAFLYDSNIVIEKYISNAREFCCAVMKIGDRLIPSNVEEINKNKIYTFQEKYLYKKEQISEIIEKELQKRIKKLAIKAYSVLNCDGIVRVDFLFNNKNNKLYVNEVNSIPGSLAFNLFGTSFKDLIKSLIIESIVRYKNKEKICYKFSSEAIEKFISMTNHLKYKSF